MSVVATRAICICVALLPAVISYGADHPCKELERSAASQKIEYLRGSRSTLKSECVEFAIGALSREHSPAAANALVSYLDFRSSRPQTEAVSHLLWKPNTLRRKLYSRWGAWRPKALCER
jgi:hypothetical protein